MVWIAGVDRRGGFEIFLIAKEEKRGGRGGMSQTAEAVESRFTSPPPPPLLTSLARYWFPAPPNTAFLACSR